MKYIKIKPASAKTISLLLAKSSGWDEKHALSLWHV
jgi:hypothetical protein